MSEKPISGLLPLNPAQNPIPEIPSEELHPKDADLTERVRLSAAAS
jgi:hypothetical protein